MVTVQLDDRVARRLREIAEKEHRSMDEVLSALLDHYVEPITPAERVERIIALRGKFDDPVTDMPALSLADWLNELKMLNISLSADADGHVPAAGELVNEVREERDADILRSIGFGDSAGSRTE